MIQPGCVTLLGVVVVVVVIVVELVLDIFQPIRDNVIGFITLETLL